MHVVDGYLLMRIQKNGAGFEKLSPGSQSEPKEKLSRARDNGL